MKRLMLTACVAAIGLIANTAAFAQGMRPADCQHGVRNCQNSQDYRRPQQGGQSHDRPQGGQQHWGGQPQGRPQGGQQHGRPQQWGPPQGGPQMGRPGNDGWGHKDNRRGGDWNRDRPRPQERWIPPPPPPRGHYYRPIAPPYYGPRIGGYGHRGWKPFHRAYNSRFPPPPRGREYRITPDGWLVLVDSRTLAIVATFGILSMLLAH